MKQKAKRTISFLLVLVCVLGLLPLSVFAANAISDAPSYITQISADYLRVGGSTVRYYTANSTINAAGAPYIFDAEVSAPGLDQTVRALCSYHAGTLGNGANGQKWNFKTEVTHPSLVALLTFVYSYGYGDFTDAGKAIGKSTWNETWTDLWFMVAQAMTWYYEYGLLIDYNSDKEGFIRQVAAEFLAAMKMHRDTWNWAHWITNWDNVDIYTIIDSADNGVTGNSAYDYAATAVNEVLEHPDWFHMYRIWEYDWDSSQTWKLYGQEGTPMQKLLIAIPDDDSESGDKPVSLTVKKLEAGTDQPLAGAKFKIEYATNPERFSVTRTTGEDGTITLTKADGLEAGQYTITEVEAPKGYINQGGSITVAVSPGNTESAVFTYYNESICDVTIRKVDADNPTVGIPGAVIRITGMDTDNGHISNTYITGDGGYISDDELKKLPAGAYKAEEITPPEGYTLSTDPNKRIQTFYLGFDDVSLVFENPSKVKVQLIKQDESSNPLAGAVFVVLKDGQLIETKTTDAAGTITVSNVSEGYYEFREVVAPAGYDKDSTPVGVYVMPRICKANRPLP